MLRNGVVFFAALLTLAAAVGPASATFSITAVDPVTRQVGSAGASCITGAIILSDVHPGVGCVHTQAYWNNQNQQYARSLMNLGYAPAAIIDSLVAHDAGGNPTIRQYGIVDLVDGGRSAAYTGVNCTDWKGHILGPTYSIQGNILLGPEIVEGMEQAFLNTPGTLADKLMAALQAAKVPGADTRCRNYGKSSISAFLRVALPTDGSTLYLDLNVNNTPTNVDPIDVLQGLYDQWKTVDVPEGGSPVAEGLSRDALVLHANAPNPFRSATVISYEVPAAGKVALSIFDPAGRRVATVVDATQAAGFHQAVWSPGAGVRGGGIFLCRLEAGGRARCLKILRIGE
jgi:uncharacterized Ntn-hydrolase superfamily protein